MLGRFTIIAPALPVLLALICTRPQETPVNTTLQLHVSPECYRFDARLNEARISAGPPQDDSKFLHHFDFKTDRTPWTVAEGSAVCAIEGNALSIQAHTVARCDSPAISGVPASEIGAILIDAWVSGCSEFSVAWRGENGEFLPQNAIHVRAVQPSKPALYSINTAVVKAWRDSEGNVGQLGLVLPAQAKIEIRSIGLAGIVDPFAGKSYGPTDHPYKRDFFHSMFARTPCSLEYDVTLMPNPRLTCGFLRWGSAPVQFRVLLEDGSEQTVLMENREDANVLRKEAVDLFQWAGRRVRIRFEADSTQPGTVALWCNPTLARAYPITETKRPMNVIWYVIDCLRATNVSCYGHERDATPTIDAVAREGTRFEWCFSPGTWTIDSVASFFTGLSPNAHGMCRVRSSISESMHMLPEDLRAAGYSTALFSTNPYLEKGRGFVRGFDEAHRFRVRAIPNRKGVTTDNYPINVAIGQFLEEHKKIPFFIYVHTIEAHGPYVPPARFTVFSHPDGSVAQTDMYDACILWADSNLSNIIGKLQVNGLWNNTLLIISADHGQCLAEYDKGLDGHGDAPYLSRVRVPLVMRLPGIIPEGAVIQEKVQELDVVPTLFELLHIAPDPQFGGWSLLGLLDRSRKSEFAQRMLFPAGQKQIWQAVVDGKWYFHDNDGRLELYDLASDPAAQNNVSAEHGDVTQRLLSESLKYREAEVEKGKAYPPDDEMAEMNEEDREELRALGYIE